MIGIATAIKDDPIDPFIFSALGNQLANFTRNSNFMVVRDSRKRLDRSFLRPFLRGWQLRLHLGRLVAAFALLTLFCWPFCCWAGAFSAFALLPFLVGRASAAISTTLETVSATVPATACATSPAFSSKDSSLLVLNSRRLSSREEAETRVRPVVSSITCA